MTLGVDGRGERHWKKWSYQPAISAQVLYINLPEQ